jgi:GntP family gluconate:H+ symporter
VAALGGGLLLGLSPGEVQDAIANGFGSTLGSIGLVIALGTVIGQYLEKTGGTQRIAEKILRLIGPRKAPLALNLAGFVISIPVFCDSGFIVLSPLTKTLARRSPFSRLVMSIALATGLYAAHVFVPPTPGPLAAAALLEADLGLLLILGLVIGLAVSLTGYVWARFGLKSGEQTPANELVHEEEAEPLNASKGYFWPIVFPVLLIALGSIIAWPGNPFEQKQTLKEVIGFLGAPVVALGIGVVCSLFLARRYTYKEQESWIVEAFRQAGLILLVTGTGGAFGAVLKTVDLAGLFAISGQSSILGLILFFGLAALLKSAQGSSTVAILTVSAIASPLLLEMNLDHSIGRVCSVLAIGAGAMTVSHVNDSYFWVVSQFSELSVKQSLRSLSLATAFQGLVGLLLVLAFYSLLHPIVQGPELP